MAGVDDALAPLAETIEAFVLGGGKRLRPAFAYWGFRGAGGVDTDQVVTALASLEFVQASALMLVCADFGPGSSPTARGSIRLR